MITRILLPILTVGLLVLAYLVLTNNKSSDNLAMIEEAKNATVMVLAGTDAGIQSQGSGAILSEDGYIVTNHHVIEGRTIAMVVLNDHRIIDAEIIGHYKQADLALLKIEANDLTHMEINQEPLRIGQPVFALGTPLGLEQTVTSGILSAFKRPDGQEDSQTYYLQSNVAINPGNSGGPLVDEEGKLIGINSWVLQDVIQVGNQVSGITNTSFGFSVPDRVVAYVVDHLKSKKKIKNKWLGLEYSELGFTKSREIGFNKLIGVEVNQVHENTPAAQAELVQGDVIIQFNEEEINSATELRAEVNLMKPDETAQLLVWRDNEEMQIEVGADVIMSNEELRYQVMKTLIENCNFEWHCESDEIQKLVSGEQVPSKKKAYTAVQNEFLMKIPTFQKHSRRCSGDDYSAARDAIKTCYVSHIDTILDGKEAALGDEAFNECAVSAFSADTLKDNTFAVAILDKIKPEVVTEAEEGDAVAATDEDTITEESESEPSKPVAQQGQNTGLDKEQACMMYWMEHPFYN